MYDFAINNVSEVFADALVARMKKFASIEYQATIHEIFERTLAEVDFEGDTSREAERLLTYFPKYLDDKAQKDNADFHDAVLVREHKVSGRIVSEYSDGRFEIKTVSGSIKIFSSLREVTNYIS